MSRLHPSDYRVRQARIAGAIFGNRPIFYPPTREGFKAFWQHARVYESIKWRKNPSRILQPPILAAYTTDRAAAGVFRKSNVAYPWPDRVFNLNINNHREWSFRWHSIFDTVREMGKKYPIVPSDLYNRGERLARFYGIHHDQRRS